MSIVKPIVASALSARVKNTPRTLLMLGESLIGQADTVSDSGSDIDASGNAYGVVNWFNILADWPFQYYIRAVDNTPDNAELQGWNKGKSSDTIAGIKARLVSDVIAYSPDVVWLSVGTNDAALETTLASFMQDYEEVCNTLLDSGAVMILDAQHNRTSWTETASEPLHMAYNHFIREFAARTNGVILNDTTLAMTDYSNADGQPYASYVTDTVHLTASGAYAIANQLVQQLGGRANPHWPGNISLPSNPQDLFDATHNPHGIINPNPFFYGTGGTTGANVTGTVPDDMQVLTDSAEVTAVASIVDAPSDAPWMVGKWIKVDVTSSGAGSAGARVRLYRTGTAKMTENYTVGDYYEAVCGAKVEAPGGNAIMQDFGLKLQTSAGSSVQALNNRSDEHMPSVAWYGMLKTQPLQADASSDGFYHQLNVEIDASVSGTQSFYVGQFAYYKMPYEPCF